MPVPRFPVAVIDVSAVPVVVTVRAVSRLVGSHEEAVRLVAEVASEVGRPVRVWLRQPGSSVLAAINGSGAYVDVQAGMPELSGSPIPADALRTAVMPRFDAPADSNGISEPAWVIPDPPEFPDLGAIAAGTATPGRRWWQRRRPVAAAAGEDPLRAVRSLTWMVANKKGGAGKTPLSVVLAAACASVRPHDVALVDINPVGNLALRAGTPDGARTVTEVAEWLATLDRVPYEAELFDGAGWQEPGGWRAITSRTSVVVADESKAATLAAPLTEAQLERVLAALAVATRVVGIDAGNDHGTQVWQTAASHADVLLVPVKLTPDTCVAAGEMLADLQKLGHADLVARRTLIVATKGPADVVDAKQAKAFRDYFVRQGYQVLDLPTDPELAGKTTIRWDRLRPATREAGLAIARAAARLADGRV